MGRRSIEQERRLAADLRRQTQIRKSGGDFSDAHEIEQNHDDSRRALILSYVRVSCIDTGGEAGLRAEPPDIGAEESHHIVKS
jgi:hypothetical protein